MTKKPQRVIQSSDEGYTDRTSTRISNEIPAKHNPYITEHLHYYGYDNINGIEYITMGPAGASFHHEGPGNVDHMMWVTVTDDGPEMANIALKGIFDRKGLDPELFGAYDRKGAE